MAFSIDTIDDEYFARLNALVGFPYELKLPTDTNVGGITEWGVDGAGDPLPTGFIASTAPVGAGDDYGKIHTGKQPLTSAAVGAVTVKMYATDTTTTATLDIDFTVREFVTPSAAVAAAAIKIPVIIIMGQSHTVGPEPLPGTELGAGVMTDIRIWTGRGGPVLYENEDSRINTNNGLQPYDPAVNSNRAQAIAAGPNPVASGPDTTLAPLMLQWLQDNPVPGREDTLIILKTTGIGSLVDYEHEDVGGHSGGFNPDVGEVFVSVLDQVMAIQEAVDTERAAAGQTAGVVDIQSFFFLHGHADHRNSDSGRYGAMLKYMWERLESALNPWISDADNLPFVGDVLDMSLITGTPATPLTGDLEIAAPNFVQSATSLIPLYLEVGDWITMYGSTAQLTNNRRAQIVALSGLGAAGYAIVQIDEGAVPLVTELGAPIQAIFHISDEKQDVGQFATGRALAIGQDWCARQDVRYGQVSYYGLETGSDKLHYDIASTLELGERMYDEFVQVKELLA